MTTYIKKDFASPNGPILLLSAKGSTTASITQANGVKDFSGNGNHGKGNNGVTVEKYGGCDCFGFPNNNSYIYLSDKKDTIFTQTSAYTFSVTFVITSKPTRSNGILVMWSHSSPLIQIWLTSDYKLRITADNNFTEYSSSLLIEVNTIYTITVSANYTTGHREVWANGNLCHIIDKAGKELTLNIGYLILGNHSITTGYNLPGYIIDARIYPRALTQNEIKYLHNGFQPNIIVSQSIPSGAILDLSARGLTTAGIAQANGVVDRSGNGNHGQAYNGVAVVNDDEMGSCFSLVNVSGNSNLQYCQFDLTDTDVFSIRNEITITTTILFRKEQLNFICGCGTTGNVGLWLLASIRSANSSVVNFNAGNLGQQEFTLLDLVLDKFYVITVTLNSNKELSLFIDGTFISSKTLSGDISTCGNPIRVGNITTPGSTVGARLLDGEIESLRIYPRALTASEVQQLADASLKKITNIKSGSSDVRQIFSNGEMIYAKTNDYSLNL